MKHANWRILVLVPLLAFGSAAHAAPWLEETFDAYAPGPLNGQGKWTGLPDAITVVSTNALVGRAAYIDADAPMLPPFIPMVQRVIDVPALGRHEFSFAVKIDTTTPFGDFQAALSLATSGMQTLAFQVESARVSITLEHPLLDVIPKIAEFDLGDVPGGLPDVTTGAYHVFAFDLDLGETTGSGHVVRDVRLDGRSVADAFPAGLPAIIWLAGPNASLALTNGSAMQPPEAIPDAVFFDNIAGRLQALEVRRWRLY